MTLILNIETSTKTCSSSLALNGKLVDEKTIKSDKFVHGEKLHLIIHDLMKKNNYSFDDIDGIGISSGPGSFTGLRIGVSTAKGIAYSLNKPLLAVDSIQIMIENFTDFKPNNSSIYFPMIDARRDEVYTAGYNDKREKIFQLNAVIVDENFIKSLANYENIYFLGDGSKKFHQKKFKNVTILENDLNYSNGMSKLTYDKFNKNQIEDTAYFVPYYLKDFKPN